MVEVNLPKIGPILSPANRTAELALGSLTVPALTPGQIGAIDAAHIWHPYSTIGAEAMPPVVAVGARGAWLTVIDDGHPIDVLDAMSSWWTAIHGHAPPGAGCGDHRSARHHEPRHVRRPDPRTRRAAGAAAGADHPRRAGHRVLQRLRIGLGGGRGQDGAAVLAQPRPSRQAPADDVARRLPRRHLHPDERVRPRRRHALVVDRRAGPPGIRPAGADRLRPGLQRGVRKAAGRARRRTRRGDRRTGGAGRRRHALPRPALPDRSAGRLHAVTTCC